jgi:hypothetical protein
MTKVSQWIRNTYPGMWDTDSSIVLDREEDSEDKDKGEPADLKLEFQSLNLAD